jgi:PKD repeat protein
MWARLFRRIVVPLIMIQLLAVFMSQMGGVKGQGQRTVRIVDNTTGSDHIDLGNQSQPMPAAGYPFTVKIMLDGATQNIAFWQVTVGFDNNSLRCTNITVPKDNPSYIFYGTPELSATDFSEPTQDGKYGRPPEVVAGSSTLPVGLVWVGVNVTNSAIFCTMDFTARRTGTFHLGFIGVDDGSLTFIQDPDQVATNNTQPWVTADFTVNVVAGASVPIAGFKYLPANPRADQNMTFDASPSFDPSGEQIETYTWDFGDNTTAATFTSPTALHKYASNGRYEVNLTVANTDNVTGSTIQQLLIGSIPTANFTYLPTVVIPPPSGDGEVTFNASESFAPNATIVSYFWDFGDNNTFSSNDTAATHKYLARGVYDVNLTVTDNYGVLNLTTVEIQVGIPPAPLFTWNPALPAAGDNVTFIASGVIGIVRYVWDFGTGGLSGGLLGVETTNETTITYFYPTTGDYVVTLTVFDHDGLHASYNQTISVSGIPFVQKTDFTPPVIGIVVVVLFALALVVRRVRTEREEALEI